MIRAGLVPASLFTKELSIPENAQFLPHMDETSFCALYQAIAPTLKGYIHKICGNGAVAEDILQDTFHRFLRVDLPQMNPPQAKAYLFKIATSLLTDHWRRLKREKRLNSMFSKTPAAQIDSREANISQALAKLMPTEKALLWLAYVEGFDHPEIAEALGFKPKSVRVLLFRARKKLARILRRQDYGEQRTL